MPRSWTAGSAATARPCSATNGTGSRNWRRSLDSVHVGKRDQPGRIRQVKRVPRLAVGGYAEGQRSDGQRGQPVEYGPVLAQVSAVDAPGADDFGPPPRGADGSRDPVRVVRTDGIIDCPNSSGFRGPDREEVDNPDHT